MNVDAIVAKLEKMIQDGADFDSILEVAVRELHETNPRFNWTGIYELFDDQVLRLGPFVGAPTDHVFIGVGRGVCHRAVLPGAVRRRDRARRRRAQRAAGRGLT